MKYGRIVHQVKMHQLTGSDFQYVVLTRRPAVWGRQKQCNFMATVKNLTRFFFLWNEGSARFLWKISGQNLLLVGQFQECPGKSGIVGNHNPPLQFWSHPLCLPRHAHISSIRQWITVTCSLCEVIYWLSSAIEYIRLCVLHQFYTNPLSYPVGVFIQGT